MPETQTDAGSELAFAYWLLEELSVPSCWSDRQIVAEAIRMQAKEGGTMQDAAGFILHQAKNAVAAGERVNRFWFSDQKYKPKPGKRQAGAGNQGQSEKSEDEARAMWEAMSPAYQAANPRWW
jgi:hypothetical protein